MALTTDTHHALPGEHSPLAAMPHDAHGGISNVVLGMLLFITSEVMFFGGLFAAYFSLRANAPQWPPVNPETQAPFALAILPFVGPATILLILSSFTCQLAVHGIRRDDRTAFLRAMTVT
ncbi:MAG: cytochrome c oxidase subunit, partial [Chloroflexota bacterium]|nr:cytochrome c oxidase subunit [Chloroflexota bacterium]